MLLKFLPKGRISINVYPSFQGCYYKPWPRFHQSLLWEASEFIRLLYRASGGRLLAGGMGTPFPTGRTWKNLPNRELLPSCIDRAPALVFLGLYTLHCIPRPHTVVLGGREWLDSQVRVSCLIAPLCGGAHYQHPVEMIFCKVGGGRWTPQDGSCLARRQSHKAS